MAKLYFMSDWKKRLLSDTRQSFCYHKTFSAAVEHVYFRPMQAVLSVMYTQKCLKTTFDNFSPSLRQYLGTIIQTDGQTFTS